MLRCAANGLSVQYSLPCESLTGGQMMSQLLLIAHLHANP